MDFTMSNIQMMQRG